MLPRNYPPPLGEGQGGGLSSDWLSASATHNWVIGDPIGDYLNEYGRQAGFEADHDMIGYDKRFDYVSFVIRQSWAFERRVVEWLSARHPVRVIVTNPAQARLPEKVEATIAAMNDRVAIIAQGVLLNVGDRMDGVPDLLVRSDVLFALCPGAFANEQREAPAIGAPRIAGPGNFHYRVIDIKFATLQLLVDGSVSRAQLAYMVQNWVYNQALGKTQGYTPPASYLLGRDLFDQLGRVPHDDATLPRLAAEASAWLRRVRAEGSSWQLLPSPTIPELRPNLKAYEDLKWHTAKQVIAINQHDLTLLPYVGPERRSVALSRGISRWDDPNLAAHVFDMEGEEGRRVDAVLAANRSSRADPLFPERISSNVGNWLVPLPGDLFVSLEAVSDQADDFSKLPERGTRGMVYLIAWGWFDQEGQWKKRHLVTRSLTPSDEPELIACWKGELVMLAQQLGMTVDKFRLFHWGIPSVPCPELDWFDVLENIIYKEPVAVRGCFGFGLVEMAKALNQPTMEVAFYDLPALPSHALSAMAGAWSAAEEAFLKGVDLDQVAAMQRIIEFSEASCRTMMEILTFLRNRAAREMPQAA